MSPTVPWSRHRRAQATLGRLAQSSDDPVLTAYGQAGLPALETPAGELRLLALDLETTGLDPRRDQVLSVGFVPIDGRRIVLSGATQLHVRPTTGAGVGQSARIHGLTDDMLATGCAAREALDVVLTALTGRVLLAHYAVVETGFLGVLARAAYGREVPMRVIDTLEIGRSMLPPERRAQPPRNALRLWKLRQRFGLPAYAAHDAFLDALASAELYLAQLAEIESDARRPVTLRRLVR